MLHTTLISLGRKLRPFKGQQYPEKGTSGSFFDLHKVSNLPLIMLQANLILFASCAVGIGAKQLWSKEPAAEDNIIMTAYPVGNGKLGGKCSQFTSIYRSCSVYGHLRVCAALPLGTVGRDIVVLNEHSLWSGGPFQSRVR
jgi:hypothetical protein